MCLQGRFMSLKDQIEAIHKVVHRFDVPVELLRQQSDDLGKFDLNLCDKSGFTPLMTEVLQNNKDAVCLLLKHGANPDIESSFGETALMMAIEYSRFNMLDDLCDYCEVNYINRNGDNALSYAKHFKEQYVIDLLIRRGAIDTGKECHLETLARDAFG